MEETESVKAQNSQLQKKVLQLEADLQVMILFQKKTISSVTL